MIEQKSAPKKQKVGSLFFHLFNRLSLWLYNLLIGCFLGRVLTCYDVLEQRWNDICTRIFGAPGVRLRPRLHKLRLRLAHLIEHSLILRFLDHVVRFFINCPLNVYGIFFFMYGAVGAAVYFIAERLSVNYAGHFGWGISGIIIAFSAMPLLFTGKSLYHAVFGSRIIGKLLRSYLGLEKSLKSRDKERGSTMLLYAGLLLGVMTGALTFFVHPATVPILTLLAALAVIVLYIPESGVLIAAGSICLWWCTGFPVLCAIAIALVTLFSYVCKMIRGKRVMHVHLIDFVVLLLAAVFVLQGMLSGGGLLSLLYGLGYAALIAMYFPTVNLMRSREWLERCYSLLAFSGAVLAILSILPMSLILNFLDMTFVRVDVTMFAQLSARYQAYFSQGSMFSGMMILLLPILLCKLVIRKSITGFFWRGLCVLAACASLLISMQLGAWVGLAVMLLLFFFTYSYRSLSRAMLLAFPVTCAAVWHKELNGLFGIHKFELVQAALDMAVVYANNKPYRRAIASGVLAMSKEHLLGVGFGDAALHRVLAYYAVPGMENVTNVQNTYLQLLAESGYLGLILLVAVLLVFVLCVLTYLRWGENATTKVRVSAGFAGIMGVLALGAFCNLMNNASLFFLFWLVIGATVAGLLTQYEAHARAVQSHAGSVDRTDIAFRTK